MLKSRNMTGYVPFVDTPLSGERYLDQEYGEPGYIDPSRLYVDQLYETLRQAELLDRHDDTTERMLRDRDVFEVICDIERLARSLSGNNDWEDEFTYDYMMGYIKFPDDFVEQHEGMLDDPDVKTIVDELYRLREKYYGISSPSPKSRWRIKPKFLR